MHARDLVKSPKKPNPEGPKRKAPTKVPSWHLTGDKAMQYITDANKRQEEGGKRRRNMRQQENNLSVRLKLTNENRSQN